MKVAYLIVWLLSNGTLQGEPWKAFDTYDECQTFQTAQKVPITSEKLALFTGCIVTTKSGLNFTGVEIDVLPSDR